MPEVPPPLEVIAEAAGADVTRLTIVNQRDAAAVVTLAATTFSRRGMRTIPNLRTVQVEANGKALLRVALSQLDVNAEDDPETKITFEVLGEFTDGVRGANFAEVYSRQTPLGDGAMIDVVGRDTIATRDRALSFSVEERETSTDKGDGGLTSGTLSDGEQETGSNLRGVSVTQAVATKKLCFVASISLTNAGVGEDFWAGTSVGVAARGQVLHARPVGSLAWETWYLGDDGCRTGTYTVSSWEFRLYTLGFLHASPNLLISGTDAGTGANGFITVTQSISSSTSQQNIGYTAGVTTPYHIIHHSIRYRKSQLTSATFGTTLSFVYNAASPTQASTSSILRQPG